MVFLQVCQQLGGQVIIGCFLSPRNSLTHQKPKQTSPDHILTQDVFIINPGVQRDVFVVGEGPRNLGKKDTVSTLFIKVKNVGLIFQSIFN